MYTVTVAVNCFEVCAHFSLRNMCMNHIAAILLLVGAGVGYDLNKV